MPVPTFGLTHLSISVSDLDRSLHFYRETFGAVEYFRDAKSIQCTGVGPQTVLALELKPKTAGKAGGISHFGFRLKSPADLDAAINAAMNSGGSLKRRGEFAPGCPFAYLLDPDGYTVEVWYEPAQSTAKDH